MKTFNILVALAFSFSALALGLKLKPIIEKVNNCLVTTETLLCDQSIFEDLKTVSMDARGEFVYFLKDKLAKNETEKVIVNLYEELQTLVTLYDSLDSASDWSTRDAKVFLGDVSIRYVSIAPIDSDFLIKLYKEQRTQKGRYGLLMSLGNRLQGITAEAEMEGIVKFAEFAKDYSKTIGDEFYLYEAAIDLIKKMTAKIVAIFPAHEGIYEIAFDDSELGKKLRMDRITILESNYREGLVATFSYSKSNMARFTFKGAGILGSTVYSSDDVYHDRLDFGAPFFKFLLEKESGEITGVFNSARYGKATFTGKRIKSNHSVYSLSSVTGLELGDLLGKYQVKVGDYELTLVLRTRSEDDTIVEGALLNDNVLISFSKVRLDSTKGILGLVDSKNERKLTLAVTESSSAGFALQGLFFNAPQGKAQEISTL